MAHALIFLCFLFVKINDDGQLLCHFDRSQDVQSLFKHYFGLSLKKVSKRELAFELAA